MREGETAIWIWAPIIAKRCPECENSPSYHDRSDCGYDETPPEDRENGLVGFRPAPVFDGFQTESEPLPELETAATGDGAELVAALLEASSSLGIDAEGVPSADWSHGDTEGVCRYRQSGTLPRVSVRDRENRADLAVTLVHEYAHALFHGSGDDPDRSERELED